MDISSQAVWWDGQQQLKYPTLEGNINADVCIIGGGIAGITAAYLLAGLKKKVVLVEKDFIGAGATGLTTAMLTQYIDVDIANLIELYGINTTRQIWTSGGSAINIIKKIVAKEKIACDYSECDYEIWANNQKQTKELAEEYQAFKKINIPSNLVNSKLKFGHQAKFHPIKYLNVLSTVAVTKGAKILSQTPVLEIKNNQVITPKGTVSAKYVLSATHAPFGQPAALFFKKAVYKTYMICADISAGRLSEGLYQDLAEPYHYFRVDKLGTKFRIVVGGEDHRSQIPVSEAKSFAALEKYLKSIVTGYEITHKWAGPIIENMDGLPYIGPLKHNRHIYYATGFSGNGITYGTLAAQMFTDYVMGKSNDYQNLYQANRLPTLAQLKYKLKSYTEIFINGAVKNTLLKS